VKVFIDGVNVIVNESFFDLNQENFFVVDDQSVDAGEIVAEKINSVEICGIVERKNVVAFENICFF
jgi:hypothetical protein